MQKKTVKNRETKRHTQTKTKKADKNPTISTSTLNINGLNNLIKM